MAPKRRGLLLGVIALVVLGVLSVAIGMVVTKKSKPTPPDAAVALAPPPDAPAPRDTAIADAALPDATADAAPRPDAAVATGSNGSSGSNGSRPPVSSEALKFLAAAEAAAAAGDAFTELASAQAALEDPGGLPPPKNLRARYLYCDGLLGTAGNRDRGCKCLRDLRNNLAISRAKAAGCPD